MMRDKNKANEFTEQNDNTKPIFIYLNLYFEYKLQACLSFILKIDMQRELRLHGTCQTFFTQLQGISSLSFYV